MRCPWAWPLLAVLAGCSTARPLRPLKAGDLAVEASLPAVWFEGEGTSYPGGSPLAGARYGLTDQVELRLNVHIGPLFAEIVGVDVGAIWHVLPASGWVPALHLTGDVNGFTKPGAWRLGFEQSWRGAVQLGAIAHWEPCTWLWPYLVSDNALTFADVNYLGSVMAGVQVWPKDTFAISLEGGWMAFSQPTARLTQPFVGLAGQGALYIGIGLEYRGGPLARSQKEPPPAPAPKSMAPTPKPEKPAEAAPPADSDADNKAAEGAPSKAAPAEGKADAEAEEAP